MSNWIYENKEVLSENLPENAIGFIYLITNLTNNKKYIGKKLLTKAGTENKLLKNGTKKKVKCRKESDWKKYWSSCDELKEEVKKLGEENFKREILCFTYSMATHTYLENKYLYVNEVLESEDWYNSNISSKIFKQNILGKI